MTWTLDGVPELSHEGYVAAMLGNGTLAAEWQGELLALEPPMSFVANEQPIVLRPPSEVVAWNAQCVCGKWRGSTFQRTNFPARQNLATRTLYVADAEVLDVAYLPGVGEIMHQEWRSHVLPLAAGAAVAAAHAQVQSSLAHLDAAVADARASGASWEVIGLNAGVSRQAAQSRWARA